MKQKKGADHTVSVQFYLYSCILTTDLVKAKYF